MTLRLDDEQRALRQVVREFLTDNVRPAAISRSIDVGDEPHQALWRQFGCDLGLSGLQVPVEFGGVGASLLEAQVVLEQMGAVLYAGPFLGSSVLAVNLLTLSGDGQAMADYLPDLADGGRQAAVVLTQPESRRLANSVVATARGSSWTLTGEVDGVLAGDATDLLLVVADAVDGPRLFAVEANAPGVKRRTSRNIDSTRRLATVSLNEAAVATPILCTDVDRVLCELRTIAHACLAIEQVGTATEILSFTVTHLKQRYQFGRVIGSFQALKHRCSDLLVDLELARSAAWKASEEIIDGLDGRHATAHVAKALASEVLIDLADASIHLHGGIGFTWEHKAHLYFRRAKAAEVLFGQPSYHWEQASQVLLA